jgi:hydroxymethylbilane synthase
MKRHRPDLVVVPFRGNVDTRLRKLDEGVADATLLAAAGLNRLGRADAVTEYLDPHHFPPAPAQGAIGIETRKGDARTAHLLAPLDHGPTHATVTAERALLATLDGSCHTAIGAFSELSGGTLTLTGQLLSADGAQAFTATHSGPQANDAKIGHALGEELLALAGDAFIEKMRA